MWEVILHFQGKIQFLDQGKGIVCLSEAGLTPSFLSPTPQSFQRTKLRASPNTPGREPRPLY